MRKNKLCQTEYGEAFVTHDASAQLRYRDTSQYILKIFRIFSALIKGHREFSSL